MYIIKTDDLPAFDVLYDQTTKKQTNRFTRPGYRLLEQFFIVTW